MRIILSIGFLFASSLQLLSQNFVPNGSFEFYQTCPRVRNDGNRCDSWDAPTSGTSDYFNTCATFNSDVDVPTNFGGTQTPRTGNAYAGLYAYFRPQPNYREYMQVTLDSLLVAGGVYTFEMYVSLGDESKYASNRMAAYISKTQPTANTSGVLSFTPQIVSGTYITDKIGWTKITGVYLATGGERYITIGVYEPAATNTTISVSGNDDVSYYYIDDVSLTRACDLPNVLLGPDVQQCVSSNPTTLLSAAGPGSRAYLWSTGETTPTITVNREGKYTVKVNTPFCTRYDTITVQYTSIPVADLGNDTVVCGSVTIELDAKNTGALYTWSNGATTQKTIATTPGVYKVVINNNGCLFRDSITLSMDTMPLLELGPNDTLCAGSSKLLTAFSPGSTYQWQNGSVAPLYTATTTGRYNVLVKRGVCSISDSIDIVFQSKPNLNLGPNVSYCFQQPVTLSSNVTGDAYLWQDGSTAPHFVANAAGTYWMELRKGKCIVSDTVVLSQKTVPAIDLGADRKVCPETSLLVNFTAIAQSALWNDASTSLSRELKAPGLFGVTVINADGCTASDSVILDTFPSPTVNIGVDSFVCEGGEFPIDPGTYASYTWQDGSNSRVYRATTAGLYAVTIKDNNSCSAADSLFLSAKPKPAISMLKLLRICNPDTLITPKGIFKTYQWQDGSVDTSYRVTVYGLYTFSVTDTNNCANSATLDVRNNCPADIFVPNAFTPLDHDGLNDLFYPVTRNVRNIEFKVFNRWGELLFETTKVNEGWDGSFMNKPATSDVYVYTVTFEAMNGEQGSRNGNVTLLR